MHLDKEQILSLPLEVRKELASDIIDSILADETMPIPDWKKELIEERIQYHNANPGNGVEWAELRKQYSK